MKDVALVTGGSLRIGKAFVEILVENGFHVVVSFHASTKEAHRLKERFAPDITLAQKNLLDVQSPDDAGQWLESICNDVGAPVKVLVNNASLFIRDTLESATQETFAQHFGIHVRAPLFLMQSFAGQAPKGACIINMLDEQLEKPSSSYLTYRASKSALLQMTKDLALALAPHIRVNAICPGATLPSPAQTQDAFQKSLQNLPMPWAVSLESLQEALLFLVCNSCVTGQILFVDNGEHLTYNG